MKKLQSIAVPAQLQRNAPNVLVDGVEERGQSVLGEMTRRMGRADLAGLDLLDVGFGVRFTQTLINRDLPFASYTGIEVPSAHHYLVRRAIQIRHWDVRNALCTPRG